MQIETLKDLYIFRLQDMHSGESQIIDALPTMVANAEHDDLRQALDDHLGETEAQKKRLERVLEALGQQHSGATSKGMQGIIEAGEALLKACNDGEVKDAGIIAAAQQVEHYEIGAYGTLCTYAEILDRQEDLTLLKQTLSEEKEADGKLNALAKKQINPVSA